jgi:SAM-dependent methyltransferase
MSSDIQAHYHAADLVRRIEQGLALAGKSIVSLTPGDLSPVDQLHTGGTRATLTLMEEADIRPEAHVLDAGCGLGGSSRVIAATRGCRVTGIDLTDSFIEAARILTRWTGLSDRIVFHAGPIQNMPVADKTFDAVLCQHLLMNVPDKAAVLLAFHRVLVPGGKLILHEIVSGTCADMAFPVPWAGSPDICFLESQASLSDRLKKAGFTDIYFRDTTDLALKFWQKVRAVTSGDPHSPHLGSHLIFGEKALQFPRTMPHNFQKDAIRVVEAILTRPAK